MRCTLVRIAENITRESDGRPVGTINKLTTFPPASGVVRLPTAYLLATLRGDMGESADLGIDIVASDGAQIGLMQRQPKIDAAVSAVVKQGRVTLLFPNEPADLVFDLGSLVLNGFGQYRFQVLLDGVLSLETTIDVAARA